MIKLRNLWLGLALLIPTLGQCASAQVDEFLPEIDAYYKVNQNVRLSFQAKETREGGDPTQAEIGPSIEFYLKPLVRLKKITRLIWTTRNPGPWCLRSATAICLRRTSRQKTASSQSQPLTFP
jgi:hypothetical protein